MANNRIKGIQIELTGDGTGLVKAVGEVNKKISSTTSALKDVNKLLKLDPGNTELLTQKQKLLNDAVNQTKEKLDKLKDAAQQAKQQLEAGAMEREQYDALQREIADTEQELKKLQSEAQAFGSVGAQQAAVVGGKMQEVGGKVEDVGKKLSVVSAGMVALGKASIDAFNEVDEGLDTVIKKTGASGEDFEEMKLILDELAATLPLDFNTIGEAIGEVNTRFHLQGEALKSTSQAFLEYADLNNTNVSQSIDNVQNALAAFNMRSEDAATLLDVLNRTGQNTGASVAKMETNLINNATALQEMGLNAYQAVGFMGQLETAGADAESVISGMKRALKSATQEGIPFNQALADLEGTIRNGTDGMDGLSAAYDLFGKSGAGVYQAVKNGQISFLDLASSEAILADSTDSVRTTFENTIDGADSFKTSANQLKITLGELGKTLGTTLKPMMDKVSETLKKLQEVWKGLSPQTQDTIVKIGLVVAAIGPALLVIGKVISTIGTLMTYAPAIIGFLTGPVAPIVALVAAIGLLVGVIVKNWDNIKSIISGIGDIFRNMSVVVTGHINQLKSTISDKFHEIVNAALTWGRDMIQNLINGITNKIGALTSKVKSVASTIASFLHFSVPDEGPLKDFDKSMPDMIDLMVKGIDQNEYKLKNAVTGIANTVSGAGTYSGVLGQIRDGIARGSVIVLDSGELVGAIAPGLNNELGRLSVKEAAR